MFLKWLSSSNVPMFQCSNKKIPRCSNPEKSCCPFFEPFKKKRQKGKTKIGKNRWLRCFFFRPFLIAPPLNTWGSGLRGAPGIWFLLRKKYTPTGWTDKNRNPPKNNHWVTFAVFWWRWKIPLSFWTTSIYMKTDGGYHDSTHATSTKDMTSWHGRSMTYIILQPYKSLRCSNLRTTSVVAPKKTQPSADKLKPKATRFGNYWTATALTHQLNQRLNFKSWDKLRTDFSPHIFSRRTRPSIAKIAFSQHISYL